MSGVLRAERIELARPLRNAFVLTWHELPRTILAGAVLGVACLPVLAALVLGATAAIPLATVPAAAAASGFASALAPVAGGERLRMRALLRIDLLWVALVVISVTLVVYSTGVAAIVAGVLAAAALVVLPLAAVYGALRERRGIAALRGALVIAAVRPSVALSVVAVGVLCAFAVAASAGVLLLVLPAVHVVYTAVLVGRTVDLVNGDAT